MKLVVAAGLILMGCSAAAAQSARPAAPEMSFVDPDPIQLEGKTPLLVDVSSDDVSSDSATGVIAANSIPDAPKPVPIAATIRVISSRHSNDFKSFGADRFNRMLVAEEFLARGLDAMTTYNRLNDPCRCYQEASRFFGLDMTPIFKNPAGAYSYSFGVATAYSFLSARLWNAGKDHPRRAWLLQRLSRVLLIGDSSMEFLVDVHNVRSHGRSGK